MHVGDDRVERMLAEGVEPLKAIGRGGDVPAVARQGASDRFSEGEVFVDNERRERLVM